MPEPTCDECPDFIPTVKDGGVCDSCRAEQWFKGDRPACSRRLCELAALAEVERLLEMLAETCCPPDVECPLVPEGSEPDCRACWDKYRKKAMK